MSGLTPAQNLALIEAMFANPDLADRLLAPACTVAELAAMPDANPDGATALAVIETAISKEAE